MFSIICNQIYYIATDQEARRPAHLSHKLKIKLIFEVGMNALEYLFINDVLMHNKPYGIMQPFS